jgi:hypothetical protein
MSCARAGALCLLLFCCCHNTKVHIFGAYHFDREADCLDGPAAVDVLEGPEPAPCPGLRCWLSPAGEVYLTDTACEAPLGFEDHTDDASGDCLRALEIYALEDHGKCAPAPGTGGGGGFP